VSAISHLPSEAATIKSGLVARAASYLKVPVRAVDPTITLAELGFDSLSAMELTGGLIPAPCGSLHGPSAATRLTT